LPVLAVDLSFKQKHPANNAGCGPFRANFGRGLQKPFGIA
jgi:hypothetical protein